jgi:antitoxin component YwqK of YwqJK toxin-antitoxin module
MRRQLTHTELLGRPMLFAVATLVLFGFRPVLADDCCVEMQLARLAGADAAQANVAVGCLSQMGSRALPGLTKLLGDPQEHVRARAAQAIRCILAACPRVWHNDHGETYWRTKLAQLMPGTTQEEAQQVLGYRARDIAGGGSGYWMGLVVRLDDYWRARIDFWEGKTGDKPAELFRDVQAISPPDLLAGYTGKWTSWYVNGQIYEQRDYQGGKPVGVQFGYYPDGRIRSQDHFANGVCVSRHSWYENGQLRDQSHQDDGLTVEKSWYENGQLHASTSRRGRRWQGLRERWYANGQKEAEIEYRGGIQHGFDRHWEENGRQTWVRRYENGTLVESK